MVHEYTIVITSKNYFGTKLIRVKPDKPIKDVEVKVTVVDTPTAESLWDSRSDH